MELVSVLGYLAFSKIIEIIFIKGIVLSSETVFCSICGKCLGKHRRGFAKDHLKQFPTHDSFLIKKLVDPLIMENPDQWFNKHKDRFLRLINQPTGNTDKTTDKGTAP